MEPGSLRDEIIGLLILRGNMLRPPIALLGIWLLFCVVVAWRAWRLSPQLKFGAWGMGGGLFLMAGADWLILRSLPELGFSFGPWEIPWVLIFCVRVFLVIALPGLIRLAGRLRPTLSARSGKIAVGVAAALNLFILGAEIEGMYWEPFQLAVTPLEFPAAAMVPGERIRVVQLTDLHVERTTSRERALPALVNGLEPDLIVITGDFLNLSYLYDETAVRDLRTLLGQLRARYGIYAVDGTVEDPARVKELMAGLGITVLDDESQQVNVRGSELQLVGISNHDPWRVPGRPPRDSAALEAVMAGGPAAATTLLLYHTPDLIETAAEQGVDFYVAGHMHGGQVRLPIYGALLATSSYGKQYEQGLYTVGPTRLYVSRGIGLEGSFAPRVRFLCLPEVVVMDLVAEATP